ncbi:MAG TPA: GlyGly-CTERM sorting domain-containing protein [Candidatus Woesearchaeota archaeon]|nr:GlyGly-CTERM sorting domain-containing protein [Candidatus Woesearchaeota archaeon]
MSVRGSMSLLSLVLLIALMKKKA